MPKFTIPSGDILLVEQIFEDKVGDPIVHKPGFPVFALLDEDEAIVHEGVGVSTSDPKIYEFSVSIPELHLEDTVIWTLRIDSQDQSDNLSSYTHPVFIQPSRESSCMEDQVILTTDNSLQFTLPFVFDLANDTVSLEIHADNSPIFDPIEITSGMETVGVDRTSFIIPLPITIDAHLEPYFTLVNYRFGNNPNQRSMFGTYVVNSQILMAASALENHLDKAKVSNVIPQLEYCQSDLIFYLKRGLDMFNSFPPNITCFTGLNMKGPLFDSWMLCSQYYALAAQILAEGSLSFDFSGQAVSLNVDRTPQLDSALGRIESALNDRMIQTKRLLLRYGIRCGDGSAGSNMGGGATALGNLGLQNSPVLVNVPGTYNSIRRYR